MASGIPYLFWNSVKTWNSVAGVSSSCRADLKKWSNRMFAGDTDALKMLDSSGKFPAASMMKTTTAIGDYDQCLSIDSAMFCSMELFPKQVNNNLPNSSFYSLDQRVIFHDGGFIQTICLPFGCKSSEVQQLVDHLVRPYLMTTGPGFITCDSAESTSWSKTFKSLTALQVGGLLFLILMISVNTISTLLHMSHIFEINPVPVTDTLISMSAITSCYEMFHVRKSYFNDSRKVLLDMIKVYSVCLATMSHSWALLGAPLANYLLDRYEMMSQALSQPISPNEAGLDILTVISGFTAFQIMWKAAKNNELPYVFAFSDRVLKFLPAMIAIVSIEMIWPLLGSGPLYTKYSIFNVNRCSQNGWMNFLFINNWSSSGTDICAPVTFTASSIIQLFLVSLIVMKIMSGSRKNGKIVCWLLIISCNALTALNAYVNNVTPTLMTPFPNIYDVDSNFVAVHAFFPTQCSAYFMGFLLGFYITEEKLTLDLSTWSKMGKWITVGLSFSCVTFCLMVAAVCLNVIPRHFAPLFILVNRAGLALSAVIGILILYSLENFSIVDKILWICNGTDENDNNNKDDKVFSWLAGFHRLTLGIFFVNMTVIHYEMFTRRRLIPLELMSVLSRSLFIMVFVLLASFLFTIVFIHPVDRLLNSYYSRMRDSKRKTK
jgi:hypothetical protein